MILIESKRILKTRPSVTVVELAKALQSSPEVVAELINLWIQKGCVAECGENCGRGCQGCGKQFLTRYKWVGP